MILLDTNVISEALKPEADRRVLGWLNRRFGACALSSVSVLELLAGPAMLDAGRRRDAMETTIRRLVRRFGGRIYPFDAASAEASARLLSLARETGRGIHQLPAKLADLQIAGIADAYGLELATRNTRDFAGLDLALINPWEDPD